jgi:hypothetical protein
MRMFFSPFLVGLSARHEKYTIFSDEKEGLLIKLTHKKAKTGVPDLSFCGETCYNDTE